MELNLFKANLPEEVSESVSNILETGIYFGYSSVGDDKETIYPMVMSYGWNPFYKNQKRSAVRTCYELSNRSVNCLGGAHYSQI